MRPAYSGFAPKHRKLLSDNFEMRMIFLPRSDRLGWLVTLSQESHVGDNIRADYHANIHFSFVANAVARCSMIAATRSTVAVSLAA
jgi:hypothetical protein